MNEFNPHTSSVSSNTTNYENVNKQCCCFSMRKVSRAVTQHFDRHLEKVGIRATQFTLLAALASTKASTLTQIAESLVMDRTTLTRNLKPLEKMGFITTVTPVDKRSKAYTLTEEGRGILDRATPHWQEAQNSIVNSLSEERYQEIQRELNQMLSVTSSLKSGS